LNEIAVTDMDNVQVAQIFSELADLLELQGEDPFKVAAYRRVARSINGLNEDIITLWREGRLEEIPGVGKAISKKIDEILRTGSLELLERTKSQVPVELLDIMRVPLVGPKTARQLFYHYDVRSRRDLIAKLENGTLVRRGFSQKIAKRILDALMKMGESANRMLLVEGLHHAITMKSFLEEKTSMTIQICGSIRRGKETVGDVDMVAIGSRGSTLLDIANVLPPSGKFIAKGEDKLSWVSEKHVQYDFRFATRENIGSMLLYFTGSKEHVVKLRSIAQKKGYKLNEYGLFDAAGRLVASTSEPDIYASFGMAYVEPELREDMGEIEAAAEGRLPTLVKYEDIKGDLHVHTNWSDGADNLETMIKTAEAFGYSYVVFTDHSKSERVANGMDEERILRQAREIDTLRKHHPQIQILHGSEVDILRGGKLDYTQDVLSALDYVVASLHKRFAPDPDVLTEAVLNALENRYVDTLGHPTGRLLGKRGENGVDLTKVIDKARKCGKWLEVDGQPRRMDLPSAWVKKAVEEGVKLVLSSDSHSTYEMSYMRFAVTNARRGWAGSSDVVNTRKAFASTRDT
jgi:DNA polymerase (family 10)